ncbi:TAP-like protein [Promicromonospora sp. AC04]|uniref:alpha/beta hydrolase n=1 Tax=Promicromonospora sp. AC04 TaxID=2135723 RepID=UPI000D3B1362|nr:alpha/beta hydrolase [Promicromonospora sp. AC04]PUB24926.1 TAP-like protein [Promicromonospora sp. AC04]
MKTRWMVRRGLTLTAVAGIAGALLAAPAAGDAARTSGPDWGACPDDVVTAVPLECATVPVPLDYDDPDGTQIEVMISRLASTNPAERQGVLLLNPGGPGGAGLAQPADLTSLGIPSSVLDAYDLIGMDPRGVGHSSPVSCGFTVEQGYPGNIPPYAPDEAAVVEQAKQAKEIADQCAAHDTEGRMRHMTTANTARDMDLIRELLGEDQLSFYGASYGSALGSAYASLFPEQSDRMVIDSNLGATSLDRDSMRRFALGLEVRFPDFATWAAERHESYGLGRTPGQVRENYLALADHLDRHPVGELNGATFRLYVFAGLYKDRSFASVAQVWQSVNDGDVEAALRAAEKLQLPVPGVPATVVEQRSGAATPSPYDNASSSFLAVTCNDTDWPEDVQTYQRDVAADRERFPLFGAASANITPCAFWPNDPVDPPVEINDEGPQNVLVLQNLRDPATPHLGAEIAREAFGDRARLVSVDAGGHGVYVYDDNPCALNTTTRFLLDGDLPDSDVFCAASTTSGLALDRAAQRERAETLAKLGW